MSPKKLTTRPADVHEARARRKIAEKYVEVAELAALEDDGTAVNVAVGIAVLAGIAAGDTICIAASGMRYSGNDHAAAAELLARVDPEMGKLLRILISLKPHCGSRLLRTQDRTTALRAARALIEAAARRTR